VSEALAKELRRLKALSAIEQSAGARSDETHPELAPGVWSRRLTQEHRIVYSVSEDRIDLLQARYHY